MATPKKRPLTAHEKRKEALLKARAARTAYFDAEDEKRRSAKSVFAYWDYYKLRAFERVALNDAIRGAEAALRRSKP